MRPEHHLVGGYVRYISPYIIYYYYYRDCLHVSVATHIVHVHVREH